MAQTAVEWLKEQLTVQVSTVRKFRKKTIVRNISFDEFNKLIEQAKEMQKQQILNAFDDGWDSGHDDAHGNGAFFEDKEDYWNNTFNK